MTKNANLLCPTRACALTQQEYTAPTQMPSSCTDAANCKDGTRTSTKHAHCRVIESKLNRTQHSPKCLHHALTRQIARTELAQERNTQTAG